MRSRRLWSPVLGSIEPPPAPQGAQEPWRPRRDSLGGWLGRSPVRVNSPGSYRNRSRAPEETFIPLNLPQTPDRLNDHISLCILRCMHASVSIPLFILRPSTYISRHTCIFLTISPTTSWPHQVGQDIILAIRVGLNSGRAARNETGCVPLQRFMVPITMRNFDTPPDVTAFRRVSTSFPSCLRAELWSGLLIELGSVWAVQTVWFLFSSITLLIGYPTTIHPSYT